MGKKGHITWFQLLLVLLNIRGKERGRGKEGRFFVELNHREMDDDDGTFETQGLAAGLTLLKSRRTAFVNFQTVVVSGPMCDDEDSFKEKSEVMTGLVGVNVQCQ